MKFIVVGLGSFGSTLSEKLTQQGNEVLGIDNDINRVDALKEKVSHTICVDAINEEAIKELPLENTDVVLVCIGANQGDNVMATALFKNLGAKKLISRATNSIHENVLKAIGVDEILRPEAESAAKWARKLCLKGMVDSFELSKDYSIIEVNLPSFLSNQTVESASLRRKHNVVLLTILKEEKEGHFFSRKSNITSRGIPQYDTVFEENDILLLYGNNKDLNKFVKFCSEKEGK